MKRGLENVDGKTSVMIQQTILSAATLAVIGTLLTACSTTHSTPQIHASAPNTDAEVDSILELQTLALEVQPRLLVGERIAARLVLKRDGERVDFDLADVDVEISNPDVLMSEIEDTLVLIGRSVGQASLTVRLGELASNTVDVEVSEARVTLTDLRISAMTLEAEIGAQLQLVAIGTTDQNEEQVLSDGVNWSVVDEGVAEVDQDGLVTINAQGTAFITAQIDGLEATIKVGSACDYPAYDARIELNSTFPPLAWSDAYTAEGESTTFSMRSLHCHELNGPSTIAVIVGAGWCSACTTLTVSIINPIAEALLAAGMEILYVEAENGQFEPADGVFASRHINRLIGDAPGIRVGDKFTQLDEDAGPARDAGLFLREHSMGFFPSAWVVRTRDMKVIADQETSEYWLPFLSIAEDPDADWSNPPPPSPPPFESRCMEGDEEAGEPNDTSLRATHLNEGALSGGICNAAPDFFRISAVGPWRLTMTLNHGMGDLDMYLWDKELNEIRTDGTGAPIGSWGQTDTEMIESYGNAIVMVMGYRGVSNTYTLNLEFLD